MHLLFLCEVHVFQHTLKLVHDVLVAHLTDGPPLKLDGPVTLRSSCVSQRHLFLNFVEIIKAVGPGQLTRWVGLKRVLLAIYTQTYTIFTYIYGGSASDAQVQRSAEEQQS